MERGIRGIFFFLKIFSTQIGGRILQVGSRFDGVICERIIFENFRLSLIATIKGGTQRNIGFNRAFERDLNLIKSVVDRSIVPSFKKKKEKR